MAKKKMEENISVEEADQKQKAVEILALDVRTVTITIEGDSPLLVNQFNQKSKDQITDKQVGRTVGKKAARDPDAEFEGAKYRMSDGRTGIPAAGIKNAIVAACPFLDLKKTRVQGSLFVLAEENGLIEVKGSEPVMDSQFVRVGPFGKKVPMERYRPRYDNWECTFKIRYNASSISPDNILNLLENAGFAIGLCEYRPQKSGSYGMFHVKRGVQQQEAA